MGISNVYKDYTAKQFEQDYDVVKVLLVLERKLENTVDAKERHAIERLMSVISLGREEEKCRI